MGLTHYGHGGGWRYVLRARPTGMELTRKSYADLYQAGPILIDARILRILLERLVVLSPPPEGYEGPHEKAIRMLTDDAENLKAYTQEEADQILIEAVYSTKTMWKPIAALIQGAIEEYVESYESAVSTNTFTKKAGAK